MWGWIFGLNVLDRIRILDFHSSQAFWFRVKLIFWDWWSWLESKIKTYDAAKLSVFGFSWASHCRFRARQGIRIGLHFMISSLGLGWTGHSDFSLRVRVVFWVAGFGKGRYYVAKLGLDWISGFQVMTRTFRLLGETWSHFIKKKTYPRCLWIEKNLILWTPSVFYKLTKFLFASAH